MRMRRPSLVRRPTVRGAGWSRLPPWTLLAGLAALGYMEILPCPFAAFLSLPCPGCGLSRAARQLLAGDVQGALALHPLSPLVIPLVAVGALWVVRGPSGGSMLHSAARTRVALEVVDTTSVILAALLIGVWIARFLGAFGGPVPVDVY
jgi:hypothetical protein